MKKKGPKGPNAVLQTKFIAAYLESRGNVRKACEIVGCSPQNYYTWRKDAEFRKRIKRAIKDLEETLFERVYNDALEEGDSTLRIFTLKALNRERFDDAYARQKFAIERGLQPHDAPTLPIRAVLVTEEAPQQVIAAEAEASDGDDLH